MSQPAGTVRRYCWDSGPEHHHHAIPHEDSTICFVAASDYDALHAQAVALARLAIKYSKRTCEYGGSFDLDDAESYQQAQALLEGKP
jgi:hypothetical protein